MLGTPGWHRPNLAASPSAHPSLCSSPACCRRQVIKAALKDSDDSTELALLYANVSPDDILLREELDALAAAHPNFKVWYTGAREPPPFIFFADTHGASCRRCWHGSSILSCGSTWVA